MPPTLTQTDSVEEQDPHNAKEDKKDKSKRPANTAFRQQRLKAWQPILTPKSVLPLFFILGIIFAPIGGLLIYASSEVEELVIDYSSCFEKAPSGDDVAEEIPKDLVHSTFKSGQPGRSYWERQEDVKIKLNSGMEKDTTVCSLIFDIPNDLKPPVFFYYRLSNFYQNHRRYVRSLDLEQLKGEDRSNDTINAGTCDPLNVDPDNKKAYYPCGLIANSMFNDTFESPVRIGTGDTNVTYPMTNKGISWSSDKDLYKKTDYKWYEVTPPRNWVERYPKEGYTEEYPPPNIQEWEEFHVWMRTAGLPLFSKLAMRNDNETMKAGSYRVDINHFFPVTKFGGTKSIVLTTRTVMGGKNPFLGIAYVVVGGICIVLGVMFTVAHLISPRKLGDHRYLTWNDDEPSTATTTGRRSFFSFNRRS